MTDLPGGDLRNVRGTLQTADGVVEEVGLEAPAGIDPLWTAGAREG